MLYLINLGYNLGFNNDDIKSICLKKITVNKENFKEL